MGFSGIPAVSTGGGVPDNSRFIVTDSDFDLLGQRNEHWGDDWFEVIGDGLFTPNADAVDFNTLSEQQKFAIDQGNDPQADIYKSQGGDDQVTLPNATNNQLTQNVLYDPGNIFWLSFRSVCMGC